MVLRQNKVASLPPKEWEDVVYFERPVLRLKKKKIHEGGRGSSSRQAAEREGEQD